jgi:hypothetical protein
VKQENLIKINKSYEVSSYTGYRDLYIKNHHVVYPPTEPIQISSHKDIKTGFLGMGDIQGSDFTVQLAKNVFTMGE